MDNRRQVELLEKNKPRQERAKRTYEAILSAAAELLVEVGVERISTNLIAERAGITVPALYRYFPNKYAVLHALGCVLMDAQNKAFEDWFVEQFDPGNPLSILDKIYEVLKATYDVTLQQAGGLEIAQALRAVGPLQELRLASHQLISSSLETMFTDILARPRDEASALKARLSVETGYGTVEMALEDTSLSPEKILFEGALMIRLYWQNYLAD